MKNKTKKILIIILIILLFPIFIYLLVDGKNLYIDRYNFKQLEKAKPILELIGENDERFFSLNEFNERYNADIKSIKNCYYISNYNGSEKYIFGFKLESLFYSYIYKKNYTAYPKYDMPYGKKLPYDFDLNLYMFEETILEPCKD